METSSGVHPRTNLELEFLIQSDMVSSSEATLVKAVLAFVCALDKNRDIKKRDYLSSV